ncbi:MAG: hypothetical protein RIT43_1635 [Bacteroidota bacterium]|jgi:uncharacterized protein (TIGR03643 family)
MRNNEFDQNYCYYSDLPSPMAYMPMKEKQKDPSVELSHEDIDRIIEMAWEDRTPFDAIKSQFGLGEADVKALMKRELKLNSYKRWRERVEHCQTKHAKRRSEEISRFRCSRQRSISGNKISKR